MKPCSAVAKSILEAAVPRDSPIAHWSQTRPRLSFTDTPGAEPQAAQGGDSENISNSKGMN